VFPAEYEPFTERWEVVIMKRLKISGTVLIAIFVSSCNFMNGELKKLDEKKIGNNEIEINWYRTSSITTIHEHVEVSKSGTITKIAELNEGGIKQIKIESDSIIIETKGTGLFYQLDKEVYNYSIVLDTVK